MNKTIVAYLRQVADMVQKGETLPEPSPQYEFPQRQYRVDERLSEDQLVQLVASFREGIPQRVLAERYGISVSSVKRVLRRYR